DFEALRDFVRVRVVLGEIEDGVVLEQGFLKLVALVRRQLDVGGDAAAAVDGAAAIGQFDFFVGVVVFVFAVVIVVVEREVRVIALDEASAGRVVLGGGER